MDRYKENPIKQVVNGKTVMKLRGISKPCEEIGMVIEETSEWIVNNNIPLNDTEAIERYIKELCVC